MRDVILAAGIALSTATQLRMQSLPLGPGDICIATWIGLTVLAVIMGKAHAHPAALIRFSIFWSLFALAESVGACIGYMTDDKLNVPDVWHDSVAYLLMAGMTCLAVAATHPVLSLRRLEWLLVVFSTAGLIVQVLAGWGVLPSFGFDPWFWDRLRGWSENPNQLALFCAVLVLLSLHLASRSSMGPRVLALCCAGVALVTGRLTKSDTFVIAMLIAGLVLVILRIHDWMTIRGNVVSVRYAAGLCVAVAIVPIGASLAPYVLADSPTMEQFALSFSKGKSSEEAKEADLRLFLWKSALHRGLQAAGLGLGPGPHLDRPEGVKDLPDPFEAHSTVLDTFLQGGILGVMALLWIIGSAAAAAYVARVDALVALVCTIVTFSIPHFILRHPIVWIALAICVLSKSQIALRRPLALAR